MSAMNSGGAPYKLEQALDPVRITAVAVLHPGDRAGAADQRRRCLVCAHAGPVPPLPQFARQPAPPDGPSPLTHGHVDTCASLGDDTKISSTSSDEMITLILGSGPSSVEVCCTGPAIDRLIEVATAGRERMRASRADSEGQ
jgi:hypothetical protein